MSEPTMEDAIELVERELGGRVIEDTAVCE